MNTEFKQQAFTIVEIMVVVAVIGILSILSIPELTRIKQLTESTITANDLRVFTDAIEVFSTETGSYPNTIKRSSIPENIKSNLPTVWISGDYRWRYINNSKGVFLRVYNLEFSAEQVMLLDSIIDDGNIAKGKLTRTARGHVNYFFQ